MSVTSNSFTYVSDLVRRHSAIQLGPGKEYLVESRLMPLARARGMNGTDAVEAYVQHVRRTNDPGDITQVVEALTTNETSWFRDSVPFTALKNHIVPTLGSDVRIWSAACSTGQEPYSIAMILQETSIPRYSILGTDLNGAVLARARSGRYSQLEVNRGLPAPMLVKNFERVGAAWQVRQELRDTVTFRQHNLLHALPEVGSFDVIFLRNVLIYFGLPTKRDILGRLRRRLRPGGYLILGAAETTVGIDPAWDRVEVTRGSVYQLSGGNA
ncbi:MAG: CheR family methyltransferase [Georgenia sp.]